MRSWPAVYSPPPSHSHPALFLAITPPPSIRTPSPAQHLRHWQVATKEAALASLSLKIEELQRDLSAKTDDAAAAAATAATATAAAAAATAAATATAAAASVTPNPVVDAAGSLVEEAERKAARAAEVASRALEEKEEGAVRLRGRVRSAVEEKQVKVGMGRREAGGGWVGGVGCFRRIFVMVVVFVAVTVASLLLLSLLLLLGAS